jgi:hypothetical protein
MEGNQEMKNKEPKRKILQFLIDYHKEFDGKSTGNGMRLTIAKSELSELLDELICELVDSCPEPRIDIQKTAGYFSELMEWKNKWKYDKE